MLFTLRRMHKVILFNGTPDIVFLKNSLIYVRPTKLWKMNKTSYAHFLLLKKANS